MAGGNGQVLPFQELREQASSFLRCRLRAARLALAGATPVQLLTEEVTACGGSSSLPDARTLGLISRAAFDQDDCFRIVQVLHKRLAKFDKKLWRESYRALIIVEHLLMHGPQAVAGELCGEADVIGEMSNLQYIVEKGFNWGLTVKNKSERVLKLLQDPSFLIDQRERAQKASHEIQGFGSFSLTFSSTSTKTCQHTLPFIARSNSHYESISTEDDSESDCDRSWKSGFGIADGTTVSDKGLAIDESELFLAHKQESKIRNVSENSLKCDVHMNKKSGFRCWLAKDSEFLSDKVALEESEPFLPRRGVKRINDIETLDHPLDFDHQGRESFLLLPS